MPAREIPGFYYDEEKKRYFKVEKNHLNAKYEQYSQSHVLREKRAQLKRKREDLETSKLNSERIQRSKAIAPSISGYLSQRIHGINSLPVDVTNSRAAFVAGLEELTASGPSLRPSDAVDLVDVNDGQQMVIGTRRHLTQVATEQLYWSKSHVLSGGSALSSQVLKDSLVSLDYRAGLLLSVCQGEQNPAIISLSQRRESIGPNNSIEDSWYNGHIEYAIYENTIWKIAFSPTAEKPPFIALATSNGLNLMIASNTDYDFAPDIPIRHGKSFEEIINLVWCDQNILALASRRGAICLYDTRTSAINGGVSLQHPGTIAGMDLGDDPYRLVVAGLDNPLCLYDIRMGRTPPKQSSRKSKNRQQSTPVVQFAGYENEIWPRTGLSTHRELGLVAAAGSNGKVMIWSMQTGKKLRTFETGSKSIAALKWTQRNDVPELWVPTGSIYRKYAWNK